MLFRWVLVASLVIIMAGATYATFWGPLICGQRVIRVDNEPDGTLRPCDPGEPAGTVR